MAKDLVIVESPAKAKTIGKFLGKDYKIKASMGHIRDLPKRALGVDVEKKFQPKYTIPADKKKVVSQLKKDAEKATTVWLASDEDREGEAIAWHLVKSLKLDDEKTKRIVFHEITKTAIKNAIDNPRQIDKNLVDAQQARRVLDRLVGFRLSPLLWKKVKPALSAGRVQSVAVRLIVEREHKIKEFKSKSSYKITADFLTAKQGELQAELSKNISKYNDAQKFLESCKQAEFSIANIEKKPGRKNPPPPYTTSSLQQEASYKLGFSVSKTMMIAQQLYESGLITYMRTDSVNLSKLALGMAKKEIENLYGKDYVHTRQFKSKAKGAQEAHEAIRPTYFDRYEIEGSGPQKSLYKLIWKRTVASQMAAAKLEKTTVKIAISNREEQLAAKGEVIKFDGFLKVLGRSAADTILPPMQVNESLELQQMTAKEKFTKAPLRYSEATLVKKMEELGIGRPSTYAPTISTIQKRGYIEKGNIEGKQRLVKVFLLHNGEISEKTVKEQYGREKGKLYPTDIGIVVNDFLTKYFEKYIDYNFTADVEKEFDEIAEGNKEWHTMIEEFYQPFIQQIDKTDSSTKKFTGERLLGQDPKTGRNVYARIGRYGPMLQLGDKEEDEAPRFASLKNGQSLQSVTLKEALKQFQFPRELGEYNGEKVTVAIGKFGPYVKKGKLFVSIKKEDPSDIGLERAKELIDEKIKARQKQVIQEFSQEPGLVVMNGRYGPYISYKKKNYKIPKDKDPAKLSLEECHDIIKNAPKKKKRSRKKK
jgi:DNA topoisomerase-1